MFSNSTRSYGSTIRQNAINSQPRADPEHQGLTSSSDNMLEAYRHLKVEKVQSKGIEDARAGIDHILGTTAALEKNASKAENTQEAWKGPLPVKNARIGKSIEVDPSRGRDLGRAFRVLSALVARDRIKADFNKQKFHERPGLRRKRLKCERWRKKFKTGLIGTVARVQKLKSMGW